MAKKNENELPLAVNAKEPLAIEKAEPSAMQLLDRAVAQGATPEALEKLYNLKIRIDQDNARAAFNVAMAELQAEIPPLHKIRDTAFKLDGTRATKADGSPVQKTWKYAPLNYMVKALKPIWVKHSFTQRFTATIAENNRLISSCIFTHRLGHSEETRFTAIVTNKQGDTLQDAASTDSFAKRYALMNALGIVPEEDVENDARAVGDPTPITPDQAEELRQWVQETLKFTPARQQNFFKAVGGTSFETIPASQYARAKAWLKKVEDDAAKNRENPQ